MSYHEILNDAVTPSLNVRRGLSHSMDMVLDESEWRGLPHESTTKLLELRVMVTRCYAITQQARECCATQSVRESGIESKTTTDRINSRRALVRRADEHP
jgi:hypothetical protein